MRTNPLGGVHLRAADAPADVAVPVASPEAVAREGLRAEVVPRLLPGLPAQHPGGLGRRVAPRRDRVEVRGTADRLDDERDDRHADGGEQEAEADDHERHFGCPFLTQTDQRSSND